eukprot:scaffold23312_cov112-Isochrysis_galbana.AAC.2
MGAYGCYSFLESINVIGSRYYIHRVTGFDPDSQPHIPFVCRVEHQTWPKLKLSGAGGRRHGRSQGVLGGRSWVWGNIECRFEVGSFPPCRDVGRQKEKCTAVGLVPPGALCLIHHALFFLCNIFLKLKKNIDAHIIVAVTHITPSRSMPASGEADQSPSGADAPTVPSWGCGLEQPYRPPVEPAAAPGEWVDLTLR